MIGYTENKCIPDHDSFISYAKIMPKHAIIVKQLTGFERMFANAWTIVVKSTIIAFVYCNIFV